jgi:hypothetical protein
MNAYERAEERLRLLLPTLAGRLGSQDARSVEELIDHNECGVALENMCAQLHEFDAALSTTELDELRLIASLLGVDVGYLSK